MYKSLLLGAALSFVPLAVAQAGLPPEPGKDPGCTVVEPTRMITLVVVIPHSSDFCALLARALGEDVLHAPVGVTPTRWHYPGARLSCRLHEAPMPKRAITIYNSSTACRWLMQSGWVRTLISRGLAHGSPPVDS
jgi:hypothetical protein